MGRQRYWSERESSTFTVQVDNLAPVQVSTNASGVFTNLSLASEHTMKIRLDGKPLSSFRFSFKRRGDHLRFWYNPFYGSWSLSDVRPGGKCACPKEKASNQAAAGSTNEVGEMLLQLKAGEAGVLSYGLYCAASNSRAGSNAPTGGNLVLILRNIGSKSINMEKVTVEDFSLEDSAGKKVKLYLWNQPRTMGYRDSTLIHLIADHSKDAVQPWTLRFKSKPNTHVEFDLHIIGIEPRKALREAATPNPQGGANGSHLPAAYSLQSPPPMANSKPLDQPLPFRQCQDFLRGFASWRLSMHGRDER